MCFNFCKNYPRVQLSTRERNNRLRSSFELLLVSKTGSVPTHSLCSKLSDSLRHRRTNIHQQPISQEHDKSRKHAVYSKRNQNQMSSLRKGDFSGSQKTSTITEKICSTNTQKTHSSSSNQPKAYIHTRTNCNNQAFLAETLQLRARSV